MGSASSPNEEGQSKMSRMLSRQPPIFDSGSDRSPVGGTFSVVLCYVACSKVRCLRAKRPTSRPRPGVRGPPSHDLCVTTRSPRSGQQTFSRRWYCAGKSEAVLPSFRHSGRSVGRPLIVMPFHATAGEEAVSAPLMEATLPTAPHLVILSTSTLPVPAV